MREKQMDYNAETATRGNIRRLSENNIAMGIEILIAVFFAPPYKPSPCFQPGY